MRMDELMDGWISGRMAVDVWMWVDKYGCMDVDEYESIWRYVWMNMNG